MPRTVRARGAVAFGSGLFVAVAVLSIIALMTAMGGNVGALYRTVIAALR